MIRKINQTFFKKYRMCQYENWLEFHALNFDIVEQWFLSRDIVCIPKLATDLYGRFHFYDFRIIESRPQKM